MLEHSIFFCELLFLLYLYLLCPKLFWKKDLENEIKKGNSQAPGRPARFPSLSVWMTSGPVPFSHRQPGPARQSFPFLLQRVTERDSKAITEAIPASTEPFPSTWF